MGKRHREGEKEHGFHVKNEEDDAEEVVLGFELDPGLADGLDAALIGGVFVRTGLRRLVEVAPKPCEGERDEWKHHGHADRQDEIEVRIGEGG